MSAGAGLRAGLGWILEQGRETMYHHEMELFGLLQAGLDDIKGVHLVGPRGLERRVATLSVTSSMRSSS